MTEIKLKALVSEALALDQQAAALQEELKELKALLVIEAQSRIDDAVATDGGGRSLVFDGMDGSVARVTFPAPSLKSDIGNEGKPFEKIKASSAPCFGQLFNPVFYFSPVEAFRAEAERLLGRAAAARLIELCEKDSKPKVSFATKAKEAP